MRRKVTQRMAEWRSREGRGCLLIHGARQVGKTYSILDFARSNYRNVVYVDFVGDPNARRLFDGYLDVDSVVMQMSLAFPDARFVPGETVIVLDEIQECPRARAALKPFADDGRYDVIASGSLLGIGLSEVPSMPVGRVDHVWMYPMDFEEFLWALGLSDDALDSIRAHIRDRTALGESVHSNLMRYLGWYTVTGGMPEAVSRFISERKFDEVRRIQNNIIEDYKSDISKHCEPIYKTRTERCFESISRHLAKDNRRFIYSDVDGSVEYKVGYGYYGYSIDWLVQAGIAFECRRVSDPLIPAEQSAMDEPIPDDGPADPRRHHVMKLYMGDTGLLASLYDSSVALEILRGNQEVNRGALTENLVACMLRSQGRKTLFYERTHEMEIDFVLVVGGRPTAVEVKSGRNRTCRSLNKAMEMYGIRGIMFDTGDIHTDDEDVEHFPIYAAAFMDCIDPPVDVELDLGGIEELNRELTGHRPGHGIVWCSGRDSNPCVGLERAE